MTEQETATEAADGQSLLTAGLGAAVTETMRGMCFWPRRKDAKL